METTTIETIAQLGAIGISALALVYMARYLNTVAQTIQKLQPSESLQSQWAGLISQQIEISQTANEINSAFKTQLAEHDKQSSRRDTMLAEAVNRVAEFMGRVDTSLQAVNLSQMTLTGVVDTMSKHVLKTNETLESVKGSMNLMPDKTELQRIRETMDELLEEVRALREENKTHYTLTAKRLETVEAAVPPLQAKLSDLVDKQNAPPAPPAPRTKREAREQIAAAQNNVVGGAASKSQARHNTDPKGVHKAPPALPIGDDPRMDYLDEVETPATKPETLENPPTDSTPKAG